MLAERLTSIEATDKKEIHSSASACTGRLQITDDGSLTLEDPESGELFHNRAGAYTEAKLNYVDASAALSRLKKQGEIAVLDVCFGLGYNSFVLICEALKNSISGTIKIQAIDSDPALVDIIPTILSSPLLSAISTSFSRDVLISQHPRFIYLADLKIEFQLNLTTIGDCLPNITGDFDYVFHDPFSPRSMPELWTVDIFRIYFQRLKNKNGAVLTYSSAVAVRGGLSEAGFKVRRTCAVGRKSGGTIGFISNESEQFLFEDLSEEELLRLASRSGVPYRDPTFNTARKEILSERMAEQSLGGRVIIKKGAGVGKRIEASSGDGESGS